MILDACSIKSFWDCTPLTMTFLRYNFTPMSQTSHDTQIRIIDPHNYGRGVIGKKPNNEDIKIFPLIIYNGFLLSNQTNIYSFPLDSLKLLSPGEDISSIRRDTRKIKKLLDPSELSNQIQLFCDAIEKSPRLHSHDKSIAMLQAREDFTFNWAVQVTLYEEGLWPYIIRQ